MSGVFTSSPDTSNSFEFFDSDSPLSSLGSTPPVTPVKEHKSASNLSSPASPTTSGTFRALKNQQQKMANITTYADGGLLEVAYPLDPTGKLASASLIWQMLQTHEMPSLSCFHREKAVTYPIGNKTFYVASCKYRRKGSCGYFVNFTQIARNPDILKKQLYPLRAQGGDVNRAEHSEIATPESNGSPVYTGDIKIPALDITTLAAKVPENHFGPSSPGPVRNRRDTPRASPLAKRTCLKNGVGTSDKGIKRTTPGRLVRTETVKLFKIPASGSVPGNEASDVQAPGRLSGSVAASAAPPSLTAAEPRSIEEVLIALQSNTGVSVRTFDRFLLRCWKCRKVIKLPHSCAMPFIDLTIEDEGEDGVVDTSEPDAEKELVLLVK